MSGLNIIEATPGEHISQTVQRAKEHLWYLNEVKGYVKFNGLEIPLNVDSNINDVCVIYSLKCELERYKKG